MAAIAVTIYISGICSLALSTYTTIAGTMAEIIFINECSRYVSIIT
jgi:hypothetical protein